MGYPRAYQDWLDLADELNDVGVPTQLDWFDADVLREAQAQAATYDLPWPPSTGDYDRWYDNAFAGARRDAEETR